MVLGVPLRRLNLTSSCNRFTLFLRDYVEKDGNMGGVVQNNQQQLGRLCGQYRVEKPDIFGSAANEENFNARTSDEVKAISNPYLCETCKSREIE
jgi:hypothetical protein